MPKSKHVSLFSKVFFLGVVLCGGFGWITAAESHGEHEEGNAPAVLHLGRFLMDWNAPIEMDLITETLDTAWKPVQDLDTEHVAVFRAPLASQLRFSPGSAWITISSATDGAELPLAIARIDDLAPGTFAVHGGEGKRIPFRRAMVNAGSATCTVEVPKGPTEIKVYARGKLALGIPPRMELVWNGDHIGAFDVGGPSPAPYATRAIARSGTNELEIAFTNDYWREDGEDRNLYLERIHFRQPDYVYQAVAKADSVPPVPIPVMASYVPLSATLEAYRSAEPIPGLTAFSPGSGYYEINGKTRAGLPLPVPGSARFECHVPEYAVAELAFAVVPASWEEGTDGIYFTVTAEAEGEGLELLEVFLDPVHYPEHRAGVRREVDLDEFAGEEIHLAVETSAYYPLSPSAGRAGTPDFDYALVAEPIVRSRAALSPRNVILISIDTLRADHLGCYGYKRDTSPFLDTLSYGCVVFENAIAQANWTLPSHVSMLASLYTSAHRVGTPRQALRGAVSLAEVLRDEGYMTQAFVDGGFLEAQFGLFDGFDSYSSFERVGFSEIIPAAEAWLEDHHEGPFFLFLHSYDVHAPYDAPKEFEEAFPPPPGSSPELIRKLQGQFIDDHDTLEENAENPVTEVELRQLINLYDAGILYVDHLLSEFFFFLGSEGLLDRSLVVITSDHGEGLMDHGVLNHGNTYYEELLHVPLLIFVPELEDGKRVADVVELVDIPPTIADWALAEIPDEFQGRSLLPVLAGGKLQDKPAYAEGLSETEYDAVIRTSDTKFIRMQGEPLEVYNLRYDPKERVNLAPQEARLVETLTKEAEAFRRSNEERAVDELSVDAAISEEEMEDLRKLGYFAGRPYSESP